MYLCWFASVHCPNCNLPPVIIVVIALTRPDVPRVKRMLSLVTFREQMATHFSFCEGLTSPSMYPTNAQVKRWREVRTLAVMTAPSSHREGQVRHKCTPARRRSAAAHGYKNSG
jgi:hypothetical protein